jgi:hypothetical protein
MAGWAPVATCRWKPTNGAVARDLPLVAALQIRRDIALLDQKRSSNVPFLGVVKRTSALLVPTRNSTMLYTIAAILVGLWLLGQVTAFTMGGLIHALLAVALIVVVLQVLQGRRKV